LLTVQSHYYGRDKPLPTLLKTGRLHM